MTIPLIGILMITDKNSALVEFATAELDNKLFVSKYQFQLPSNEQLANFVKKEFQNYRCNGHLLRKFCL